MFFLTQFFILGSLRYLVGGALFVKAKNKKKQMELSYKINIADSQLLISLIPKVILMCFLLLRTSFR